MTKTNDYLFDWACGSIFMWFIPLGVRTVLMVMHKREMIEFPLCWEVLGRHIYHNCGLIFRKSSLSKGMIRWTEYSHYP